MVARVPDARHRTIVVGLVWSEVYSVIGSEEKLVSKATLTIAIVEAGADPR
jgi:hypothetical protein